MRTICPGCTRMLDSVGAIVQCVRHGKPVGWYAICDRCRPRGSSRQQQQWVLRMGLRVERNPERYLTKVDQPATGQ